MRCRWGFLGARRKRSTCSIRCSAKAIARHGWVVLPAREHGYYELFVWRHGKPGYPCTGFRMVGGTTTVHFTVPYELKPGTKLVVTEVVRGKANWPGRVVMRSV